MRLKKCATKTEQSVKERIVTLTRRLVSDLSKPITTHPTTKFLIDTFLKLFVPLWIRIRKDSYITLYKGKTSLSLALAIT